MQLDNEGEGGRAGAADTAVVAVASDVDGGDGVVSDTDLKRKSGMGGGSTLNLCRVSVSFHAAQSVCM